MALERHRVAVVPRLGRRCLGVWWVFPGHRPRCYSVTVAPRLGRSSLEQGWVFLDHSPRCPDTCAIPMRLPEFALERHRVAVGPRLGKRGLGRGWVFFGHTPRCHGTGEPQCGGRHVLIGTEERGGLRMIFSWGTGTGPLSVGFVVITPPPSSSVVASGGAYFVVTGAVLSSYCCLVDMNFAVLVSFQRVLVAVV